MCGGQLLCNRSRGLARFQQTTPVTVNSADDARAALLSDDLSALIGTAECDWLDAKSQPYKLGNPASDSELIKDVVELANHQGGLLLIGFTTRKAEDGREVIDAVQPFQINGGIVESYRMRLRSKVVPLIQGLAVRIINTDESNCVLVVDVPRQADASKPFTMPGPAVGKLYPSVAVPLRDGDGTHWLDQAGLQRLLALGLANSGGGIEDLVEAVAQAADRAMSSASQRIAAQAASDAASRSLDDSSHRIMVGSGVPGYTRIFGPLYNAVGPTTLGLPTTVAEWEGPIVVQYFDMSHLPDDMVMCAWPPSAPVAMPGSVWKALHNAGGSLGVEALGLPDAESLPDPTVPVVAPDATEVALCGGSLGPGHLIRDSASRPWRWEPQPQLTMSMSGQHAWSGEPVTGLLLRAHATLPLQGMSSLGIDKVGRERLLAALENCELSATLEALTLGRGSEFTIRPWQRDRSPSSYQTSTSAQYVAQVEASEGRPAVTTRVTLNCPNAMRAVIMTGVELQIDFTEWSLAIESGASAEIGPLITLREVLDFFVAAWNAATAIVPLGLMRDPQEVPLAGTPKVEFYLESTSRETGTPDSHLDSFIDISAFGEPPNTGWSHMSTAIIAPLKFDESARRVWVTRALVSMANRFGFIDAEESRLACALDINSAAGGDGEGTPLPPVVGPSSVSVSPGHE